VVAIRDHTRTILDKAAEIGFHAMGVVNLGELQPEFETFYYQWLKQGYHGDMAYMNKNAKQRFQPDMLLENAKTAVVVMASYYHDKPKMNSRYKISRYALGLDYHYVVKQKLNTLLKDIQTIIPEINGRAFTDSAPVPERYLAVKSGLGFIGKNGMLINADLGSYAFIGVLYLDAELGEIEQNSLGKDDLQGKEFNQCADCELCMSACPNGAIIEPGIVDSNKCISYRTIEYKGEFDAKDKLAGYIFGCDICQQVCPYNKDIKITGWPEFAPIKEVVELTDEDWEQMGSSQFKRLFSNTVLFRTGLKRLRRNKKSQSHN
jgi:epoxyqueuosine reductase